MGKDPASPATSAMKDRLPYRRLAGALLGESERADFHSEAGHAWLRSSQDASSCRFPGGSPAPVLTAESQKIPHQVRWFSLRVPH